MADRGYTLIDFKLPPGIGADCDRIVRFMEYVRSNFDRIVRNLPAGCEVDLLASGHAHNAELVPLLGLCARTEVQGQVPDPFQMINEVSKWCAGLSEQEVNAIIARTTAPTWGELVRVRVHPPR